MKFLFIFGLALFSFNTKLHAVQPSATCVSENCDLYRQEAAKFQTSLATIGCAGPSDKWVKCDQVKLAEFSKNYSAQMKALFESPAISTALKNDNQFNSKVKLFSAKTQNTEGIFEIVPVLSNPNIGVHWGAVENNQAVIDRIVDIDPKSPSVKDSNWYLTQWKKDTPLMLSPTRKDPIITNSSWVDSYLGKPLFEIQAPVGKYGVETGLYIYRDPANGANVFEIVGHNGWINNVGGSNVFLSSSIIDTAHSGFDSSLYLTFNGKLSRMNAKYFDNSRDTRNGTVLGFAFAAFTAYNSASKTSMFIQIAFGDTRGPSDAYRGCYMHDDAVEIVYTNNLDNDFVSQAAAPGTPLVAKKYYLNKYLCDALTQNYKCPSGFKAPNFQALGSNMKDWTITGFYTGLETQVAKAKSDDQNSPGPTLGDIELGFQYSNMRISADTNDKLLNCGQVLSKVETPAVGIDIGDAPAGGACSKGRFKSGNTYIDFSCGCGVVQGGSLQPGGCYHKVSPDQTSPVTPAEPAPVVSTPVATPPVAGGSCTKGSFKSGDQTIDFACGCGAVAGGLLQPDGCYHKVSNGQSTVVAAPVEPSPVAPTPGPTCSKGSFKSGDQTIDFSCGCGAMAGGLLQNDGCYHKVSDGHIDEAVAAPVENKCTKGTFKSNGKTIEYSCQCGAVANGKLQLDGCYHREI